MNTRRARNKRPKPRGVIEDEEEGNSTGNPVSQSPTAELAAKRMRIQLEKAKKNEASQAKVIEKLTKEKEDLLAEVAKYERKRAKANEEECISSDSQISTTSTSSYLSSSYSSTSEEERKKKGKKKRKKEKKTRKKGKKQKRPKRKKAKSSKDKGRRRAMNPQQVVERYKKVLGHFQKGKNLSESYNAVDVNRNTIAASASIPELAISAPDKYADVLQGYSRSQKLNVFVQECSKVLSEDPELMAKVDELKDEGKLLPVSKRT
ncbi:Coiled-coil domain-containing protein 106 [Xyrichtys novacula]|uniref:Coiled-coil domain-containing protein 106 n=1 Tax=Xyrichtys novacula TaxID=13765 RepID=A0AAV1G6V5_XYRNO|nr:Coiled-coil domain-containing protein 106 [Xyrichtys novacula]